MGWRKNMRFDIYKIIPYAILLGIVTIASIGVFGLPKDFKVDVEYINGILTASSILFGFWAILIERKPEERTKKLVYENFITKAFFFSFAFLVFSVLSMHFSALNIISSVETLVINTISFCLNAYFLTVTLYYYKFKEI